MILRLTDCTTAIGSWDEMGLECLVVLDDGRRLRGNTEAVRAVAMDRGGYTDV